MKNITLDPDKVIVSFDVCSLYTNVPTEDAINHCADLLYSGRYKKPPVRKQTFIELAKLCNCDVIMLTHKGYFKQTDGLAMGSPPAPYLANGWLSQYDQDIKSNAKIYERYMDDVLRNIKKDEAEKKLDEINKLNPEYLKFTINTKQIIVYHFLT